MSSRFLVRKIPRSMSRSLARKRQNVKSKGQEAKGSAAVGSSHFALCPLRFALCPLRFAFVRLRLDPKQFDIMSSQSNSRVLYENLDTSFVNLWALLRYLSQRAFVGRVHVELKDYTADVF